MRVTNRRRVAMNGLLVLACASASALAQQATTPIFTPYNPNSIYAVGETVGWKVVAPEGDELSRGKYTYVVKRNQFETIGSGEFDLSAGPATIEVKGDQPEMINVTVTPPRPASAPATTRELAGGRRGPNYGLMLGAAVAPEKLEPSAPRPADFDAFWDAKLKQLADVPMNPQLTPVTESVPEGVELAKFKVDSLDSHVQGYVAKPKREGKFPALILYQYAGVYVLPPTNSTNRAQQGWLCLNVDSHDLPPDTADRTLNNYASVGNTDRETSYFLNMYLRDTRAIQYLKSRDDWDGKTIVLMGMSMGGQQTLVTAGLNPDVTAALAWVPSGTDFLGDLHGRKLGYPNWNTKNPQVAATGPYFDVVNFASRIKSPTFIALGFLDTISSPVGIWTAYDQIAAPKEAIALPRAAHNNQAPPETEAAWGKRSEEVLDAILHGRPVAPRGISPSK